MGLYVNRGHAHVFTPSSCITLYFGIGSNNVLAKTFVSSFSNNIPVQFYFGPLKEISLACARSVSILLTLLQNFGISAQSVHGVNADLHYFAEFGVLGTLKLISYVTCI